MQTIIYLLGLSTGLLISILVVVVAKLYTRQVTTFLEKPIGTSEIVGDSDEEAEVRENLQDEQIII